MEIKLLDASPHEKLVAQRELRLAVKEKRLFKPTRCQKCCHGVPPDQLHGHHFDYNKPLNVCWYCTKCHHAVHNLIRWFQLTFDWLAYCTASGIDPKDAKLPACHHTTGLPLGYTQLDYFVKHRKHMMDSLRFCGLLYREDA